MFFYVHIVRIQAKWEKIQKKQCVVGNFSTPIFAA